MVVFGVLVVHDQLLRGDTVTPKFIGETMTTQFITSLSVLAIVASIVNGPAVPTEGDTSGVTPEMSTIGSVRSIAAPTSMRTDPGSDRVFHPDYSRALSAEQMTAAWNAEINRLFPVPITGGG
jgi:hypothetical protein